MSIVRIHRTVTIKKRARGTATVEDVETGIPGRKGDRGIPGPPGQGVLVGEDVTSQVNGVRTLFLLSNEFMPGGTQVYLNGLLQCADDYEEALNHLGIEFNDAPLVGDRVLIWYASEGV